MRTPDLHWSSSGLALTAETLQEAEAFGAKLKSWKKHFVSYHSSTASACSAGLLHLLLTASLLSQTARHRTAALPQAQGSHAGMLHTTQKTLAGELPLVHDMDDATGKAVPRSQPNNAESSLQLTSFGGISTTHVRCLLAWQTAGFAGLRVQGTGDGAGGAEPAACAHAAAAAAGLATCTGATRVWLPGLGMGRLRTPSATRGLTICKRA